MQCNLYVYFELKYKYLNVIVHYKKKKRNTKEIYNFIYIIYRMYEDKKINYIFIVQNKKLEKFINCTMNIIFKSVLIEAVPYDNIIYQISFSYRTYMYIHIYD